MIQLYAFVPAGTLLPAVAGIGGAEVGACPVQGLDAVVGPVADGDAGRDAVLAHGLVVEALREVADAVLPARFGARFSGRDELREALAGHVSQLRDRLEAVRGCAEFGVRMVADGDPPPDAADGTAYMRMRLTSLARAAAVADDLHGPLARCARASLVAPGSDHSAAYLVRDEMRPAFERALEEFMAAHPGVTVVCTGPWAPYSFAEAA